MKTNSYMGILSKVLPVIFLFILGFMLNKRKYLNEKTIDDLKKLIVNIALPSMLFTSFSQTSFGISHLIIIGIMFIVCILLLLAGEITSKILRDRSPYMPLLMTGFEAGMLGYSIFTIMFGADSVFKFAIIDLGQVVFVFFVMVTLLVKYNNGSSSFKDTLVSFAKTPVIGAIFLGILVQKTGLINILSSNAVLSSLLETLKLVSVIITPLICIIIGYEIKFESGSFIRPLRIVVLRFTILILSAMLINNAVRIGFLHLDRIFQEEVMLMFILTPPFIIPLYIKGEDTESKKFIFNTLSLNTVISIAAMFFVSAVYLR